MPGQVNGESEPRSISHCKRKQENVPARLPRETGFREKTEGRDKIKSLWIEWSTTEVTASS